MLYRLLVMVTLASAISLAEPIEAQFTINPVSVTPVQEGARVSFTATTTGGDSPITFAVLSPENANINEVTGEFTWMPGPQTANHLNPNETVRVVLQAKDATGATTTRVVPIQVQNVPLPPLIPEEPVLTVSPDRQISYPITGVRSPEGDQFTFSAASINLPENAALSPQGVFTWKPTMSQVSRLRNGEINSRIPFRVTTVGGGLTESTLHLRVADDFGRPTIQLERTPPEQISQGEEIVIAFRVISPERLENVSVIPTDLPGREQVQLDSTTGAGTYRWVPPYNYTAPEIPRPTTVTISVRDRFNRTDSIKTSFRVVYRPDPCPLASTYDQRIDASSALLAEMRAELTTITESRNRRRTSENRRSAIKIIAGAAGAIFPTFKIGGGDTPEIVAGIGAGTVALLELLEKGNVFPPSTPLTERIGKLETAMSEVRVSSGQFTTTYADPSRRFNNTFDTQASDLGKLVDTTRTTFLPGSVGSISSSTAACAVRP
jgi:hypothetical protein